MESLPTVPAEIVVFLACLSLLVFLVNQCATLWYKLRGKPTPGEIQAANAVLSERIAVLEKQAQDNRVRIERLEGDVRDIITKEVSKIYNRINAVADASAFLTGKVDAVITLLQKGS